MRAAPSLLLVASLPVLGPTLSGCVALAVPVAAAGVMGKRVIDPGEDRAARTGDITVANAEPGVTYLPAGSSLPPPTPVPTASRIDDRGSGEAAAASYQAWRALIRFAAKAVEGRPEDSMILAGDASLDSPRWVPCAQKPLAVVFDSDVTMIRETGASTGKVTAVPGAKDAIGILRTMGIAAVFSSNGAAADPAVTEAALVAAGLGPAKPDDTLFLSADDAAVAQKDVRRAAIAARYCVIAMAGDQLGDFSDLFDAGRARVDRDAAASSVSLAAKWGAGWFMLPATAGLRGDPTP